nr:hypothetical protein Iba_chr05fCG7030 [Ipomoea batatas]
MDDKYIGGLERKSSLSCFHGVRRYSFVFKRKAKNFGWHHLSKQKVELTGVLFDSRLN